jgi:hypothetical protein
MANDEPLIEFTIVGLRGAMGRFASMADTGLREIAAEQSEALAEEVAQIYRDHAPRSQAPAVQWAGGGPTEKVRTTHFADTIGAEAAVTATGFDVSVAVPPETTDLRGWLDVGTKARDIFPRTARVLSWHTGGEWAFAKSVHHPGVWGSTPNPHWEDTAFAEAEPRIIEAGNKIGVMVTGLLSGSAAD